ncbi:NAD-dependent epimerase/dehydratase family protein [Haladaptatus sp. F3-133]|uniref:NAD-dependent epimerase/dehydratase family protein n=1 Tax=Halorutilus salinus TaxID=2487751 RepID=A0A9Q4GIV1_9EURY|nr:NAD-dependent epimerase/dehydratase family protein [Halorutilus salinus]
MKDGVSFRFFGSTVAEYAEQVSYPQVNRVSRLFVNTDGYSKQVGVGHRRCGLHRVSRSPETGRKNKIEVIDSLGFGERGRLPESVELHEIDLLNRDEVSEAMSPDTDIVFHLAANSDVRSGAGNLRLDLEQNTVATNNLLEAMKETSEKR